MPPQRRIIFSHECDAAAERIGGYKRIDPSLDPVLDALARNPYGFPMQQSDWFDFRYIVTKPIDDCPALIWTFTIENGDVTLRHVEEDEAY